MGKHGRVGGKDAIYGRREHAGEGEREVDGKKRDRGQ